MREVTALESMQPRVGHPLRKLLTSADWNEGIPRADENQCRATDRIKPWPSVEPQRQLPFRAVGCDVDCWTMQIGAHDLGRAAPPERGGQRQWPPHAEHASSPSVSQNSPETEAQVWQASKDARVPAKGGQQNQTAHA